MTPQIFVTLFAGTTLYFILGFYTRHALQKLFFDKVSPRNASRDASQGDTAH